MREVATPMSNDEVCTRLIPTQQQRRPFAAAPPPAAAPGRQQSGSSGGHENNGVEFEDEPPSDDEEEATKKRAATAPPFRTGLQVLKELDDDSSPAPLLPSSPSAASSSSSSILSSSSSLLSSAASLASALASAYSSAPSRPSVQGQEELRGSADALAHSSPTPTSPVSRLVFPSPALQTALQSASSAVQTLPATATGTVGGAGGETVPSSSSQPPPQPPAPHPPPPHLTQPPFARMADIPEDVASGLGSEQTWRVKAVVSDVEGFKHKKKFIDLRVFVEDATCAKRAVTLGQSLAAQILSAPYGLKKQDKAAYALALQAAERTLQATEGCLTLRFLPPPGHQSADGKHRRASNSSPSSGGGGGEEAPWVLTCTSVEPPSLPRDAAALVAWVEEARNRGGSESSRRRPSDQQAHADLSSKRAKS